MKVKYENALKKLGFHVDLKYTTTNQKNQKHDLTHQIRFSKCCKDIPLIDHKTFSKQPQTLQNFQTQYS